MDENRNGKNNAETKGGVYTGRNPIKGFFWLFVGLMFMSAVLFKNPRTETQKESQSRETTEQTYSSITSDKPKKYTLSGEVKDEDEKELGKYEIVYDRNVGNIYITLHNQFRHLSKHGREKLKETLKVQSLINEMKFSLDTTITVGVYLDYGDSNMVINIANVTTDGCGGYNIIPLIGGEVKELINNNLDLEGYILDKANGIFDKNNNESGMLNNRVEKRNYVDAVRKMNKKMRSFNRPRLNRKMHMRKRS